MAPVTDTWLSAQEIAAAGLPGMPGTKRGVTAMAERLAWDARARTRSGRGGGLEYPVDLFPAEAQRVLLGIGEADIGAQKVAAVEAVFAFRKEGHGKAASVALAAHSYDVSESSLWRWLASVEGLDAEARAVKLTETPEARRVAFEAEVDGANAAAIREAGLAAFNALPEAAQAVAEARAAILKAVAGLATATGLSMKAARDVFAEAWDDGEDDFGLGAEMRGTIPRLSRRV